MWPRAENTKNWIMRTACVLLVLVLLSTQLVCRLYARFAVEGSGGDSARAAAFVFVTEDGEDSQYFDLSEIQKPGDSATYNFTVSNSNSNGSAVSEVAEQYSITVQLNGSMPLTCTINDKTDGKNDPVLSAEITENTESLPVISQTAEAGTLPAGTSTTHTYTMTVQWPETEKDSKYASRSAVAEVLLTVKAEQID